MFDHRGLQTHPSWDPKTQPFSLGVAKAEVVEDTPREGSHDSIKKEATDDEQVYAVNVAKDNGDDDDDYDPEIVAVAEAVEEDRNCFRNPLALLVGFLLAYVTVLLVVVLSRVAWAFQWMGEGLREWADDYYKDVWILHPLVRLVSVVMVFVRDLLQWVSVLVTQVMALTGGVVCAVLGGGCGWFERIQGMAAEYDACCWVAGESKK